MKILFFLFLRKKNRKRFFGYQTCFLFIIIIIIKNTKLFLKTIAKEIEKNILKFSQFFLLFFSHNFIIC